MTKLNTDFSFQMNCQASLSYYIYMPDFYEPEYHVDKEVDRRVMGLQAKDWQRPAGTTRSWRKANQILPRGLKGNEHCQHRDFRLLGWKLWESKSLLFKLPGKLA